MLGVKMKTSAYMIFLTIFIQDYALALEIPQNIVYKYASENVASKTKEHLNAILKKRMSLRSLFRKQYEHQNLTIVGSNIGDKILRDEIKDPFSQFLKIQMKVPMHMADTLEFNNYGIKNEEQTKIFSQYFWKGISFDSDFRIRKLTSEEITLIWFFIGWDLEEPIFVVEDSKN